MRAPSGRADHVPSGGPDPANRGHADLTVWDAVGQLGNVYTGCAMGRHTGHTAGVSADRTADLLGRVAASPHDEGIIGEGVAWTSRHRSASLLLLQTKLEK